MDNSLGRLWLLNRPSPSWLEQMAYYIPPKSRRPTSCASTGLKTSRFATQPAVRAHMLTYAFDLLYAIYEEEGYDAGDPERIRRTTSTASRLDERAGELAASRLTMKVTRSPAPLLQQARRPNITVLEKVEFQPRSGLYTWVLAVTCSPTACETLQQFSEADNFWLADRA